MKMLTVATTATMENERWSTNDWDFGDGTKFPTLRSYEGTEDNQIQGFVICDQLTDYVSCDTETIALRGVPVDFGARVAATTLQLVITGRNLSGAVTLTTTMPFSFGGSLTTTVTPNSNEFISTSIPITLTPTSMGQAHESTITISGGGLSLAVEIAVTGITIPPLTEVNGSLGIQYIEQLIFVREDLDGDYVLMNDLDFDSDDSYASGTVNNAYRPSSVANPTDATTVVSDPANGINPGFVPIGTFAGTFDGNDFTISNLYINKIGDTGLFGATSGSASIRNLGLINVYIKASATSGSSIGTLVGYKNGGTVTNCHASGTVNVSSTTTTLVGGLVGFNSAGAISNSYASTNVSNTTDGGDKNSGGLVGRNNSSITNCYATGDVTGTGSGGLVGNNGGTVTNSYATGTATGTGSGGLVGNNGGTITNSYYEANTSDANTNPGARTQSDLQLLTDAAADATNGTGWSTDNWDFGTDSQYPALRSYEGTDDNRIQGFTLCDQPDPRADCVPTVVANAINFGAVTTATTLQLGIAGENLSGAITLSPLTAPFSYATDQALTLTPTNGSISESIDVTYTPTSMGQAHESTITISGMIYLQM